MSAGQKQQLAAEKPLGVLALGLSSSYSIGGERQAFAMLGGVEPSGESRGFRVELAAKLGGAYQEASGSRTKSKP